MKQISTTRFLFIGFMAIAMLFGSCKSSHDINSGGIVQKRKYTKGYHVNARTNKSHKPKELHVANVFAIDSTQGATSNVHADVDQPLNTTEVGSRQIAKAAKGAEKAKAIPLTGTKPEQVQETARVITVNTSSTVKASKNAVIPNQDLTQNTVRITPTSAILSFIFGIAGLFVAAIIMGPLAIIFGIVGLSRIDSNPGLYKGKGFAIAGLILGIICFIIILAALASA